MMSDNIQVLVCWKGSGTGNLSRLHLDNLMYSGSFPYITGLKWTQKELSNARARTPELRRRV